MSDIEYSVITIEVIRSFDRQPPRKRRTITIYSDDKDDEDLTSYYTFKAINEKKSRLFRAQWKEFQSTPRLFLTMFRHISSYQECLISWLKTFKPCQMESSDNMRMTILLPGLKLGVFVTWRDVSAMSGEAVLEGIMKVLQSIEIFRSMMDR